MPFPVRTPVELVADALVYWPEQEPDLAGADADVPGGDVGELPDVPLELGHERLAEAHDLAITLALGVEVGASLAAAHRQRRQRILEDLLERQELQHAQVQVGWKRRPPL